MGFKLFNKDEICRYLNDLLKEIKEIRMSNYEIKDELKSIRRELDIINLSIEKTQKKVVLTKKPDKYPPGDWRNSIIPLRTAPRVTTEITDSFIVVYDKYKNKEIKVTEAARILNVNYGVFTAMCKRYENSLKEIDLKEIENNIKEKH